MATEIQKCLNYSAEVITPIVAAGGMGYLCARLFLTIDPVHAAVFSASASLISTAITPFFEKNFCGWAASDASKICGRILGIGTAIALSAAASTVLGFPITFNAGLIITGTIFAVIITAAAVFDFVNKKEHVKL
jgi:hypothetical protein